MMRRISLAALALLLVAPLAAQAPAGYQMRVDRSSDPRDPDDVPEVTVTTTASGFQVNTGPAVVLYNPSNTATGSYTLSGTFTLQEPSGHVNYYGLVLGAGAMEGSSQNYLYFLIGQNGTYVIKHRANDETVHDIMARTPHEAINRHTGSPSVNTLEVRVSDETVEYVANGSVVHSTPNRGMAGRTDGIYGVRVNHVIPGVLVEGLRVSR